MSLFSKLAIILVASLLSSQAYGFTLACGGDDAPLEYFEDRAILFEGWTEFKCRYEGDSYLLSIDGRGVGLEYNTASGIVLQCPFADDPKGMNLYGIRTSLSVVIGADMGVLVGTDGVCFLGGLSVFGVGASLMGVNAFLTPN